MFNLESDSTLGPDIFWTRFSFYFWVWNASPESICNSFEAIEPIDYNKTLTVSDPSFYSGGGFDDWTDFSYSQQSHNEDALLSHSHPTDDINDDSLLDNNNDYVGAILSHKTSIVSIEEINKLGNIIPGSDFEAAFSSKQCNENIESLLGPKESTIEPKDLNISTDNIDEGGFSTNINDLMDELNDGCSELLSDKDNTLIKTEIESASQLGLNNSNDDEPTKNVLSHSPQKNININVLNSEELYQKPNINNNFDFDKSSSNSNGDNRLAFNGKHELSEPPLNSITSSFELLSLAVNSQDKAAGQLDDSSGEEDIFHSDDLSHSYDRYDSSSSFEELSDS